MSEPWTNHCSCLLSHWHAKMFFSASKVRKHWPALVCTGLHWPAPAWPAGKAQRSERCCRPCCSWYFGFWSDRAKWCAHVTRLMIRLEICAETITSLKMRNVFYTIANITVIAGFTTKEPDAVIKPSWEQHWCCLRSGVTTPLWSPTLTIN